MGADGRRHGGDGGDGFHVDRWVDTLGGFIRHHEIAELVRVLAPIYVKFGLRNHPDVYPSGGQHEALNVQLSRERVRRAEIGLSFLHRAAPDLVTSELGASGLAVPVS